MRTFAMIGIAVSLLATPVLADEPGSFTNAFGHFTAAEMQAERDRLVARGLKESNLTDSYVALMAGLDTRCPNKCMKGIGTPGGGTVTVSSGLGGGTDVLAAEQRRQAGQDATVNGLAQQRTLNEISDALQSRKVIIVPK
jgi:hypothetical protein